MSMSSAMHQLGRAQTNEQLDALLLANTYPHPHPPNGVSKLTLVSNAHSAPVPTSTTTACNQNAASTAHLSVSSTSASAGTGSSFLSSPSRTSLSPSHFSSSTGTSSASHLSHLSRLSQLSRLSSKSTSSGSGSGSGSAPTSPTALNYLIPYAEGEDALGVTVGRECAPASKNPGTRTGRGGAGNMKKLIQKNRVCVDVGEWLISISGYPLYFFIFYSFILSFYFILCFFLPLLLGFFLAAYRSSHPVVRRPVHIGWCSVCSLSAIFAKSSIVIALTTEKRVRSLCFHSHASGRQHRPVVFPSIPTDCGLCPPPRKLFAVLDLDGRLSSSYGVEWSATPHLILCVSVFCFDTHGCVRGCLSFCLSVFLSFSCHGSGGMCIRPPPS